MYIITCYFQFMRVIVRLKVETSSRPRTPSPPSKREAGGVVTH